MSRSYRNDESEEYGRDSYLTSTVEDQYGEDYGRKQNYEPGVDDYIIKTDEYGEDYDRKQRYQSGDDYGTKTEEYGEKHDRKQRYQSGDGYGTKTEEYGEDYVPQQSSYESYAGQDSTYGITETNVEEEAKEDRLENLQKEEARHKKFEHFAGAEALAAGAYALYERHEAKVDPENAGRHKLEEEIAATGAAGGAAFGLFEHHQKKKTEEHEEEVEGKKHGWFS